MSHNEQYPSVVSLKTYDNFKRILTITDKSPFFSCMFILLQNSIYYGQRHVDLLLKNKFQFVFSKFIGKIEVDSQMLRCAL